MSDDFVSKSIKGILLNGINLSLESIEEEQHYIYKMLEYFEEETDFTSYLRKDKVLEIENSNYEIALEVYIVNSTLFMVPYTDNVFDIFTEILRFISRCHESIVRDFRGLEEFKIESIGKVNGIKNEKEEEESAEEPASDDDFEWI